MMNDSELERIVTNITHRHSSRLYRDAAPESIKELRSIQLDALRHAREMVESKLTKGRDNVVLHDLNRIICEMELR